MFLIFTANDVYVILLSFISIGVIISQTCSIAYGFDIWTEFKLVIICNLPCVSSIQV